MSFRVMVTGGAGFIGSSLTERLTAEGHEVVVVDCLLPQVHGTSPASVSGEVIRADVRRQAALRAAMHGVDVVHHLAAETGVGQSQYEIARYVGVNTFGTAAVLQAAAEAGVGQFVLASSRAVYGEGSYLCPACRSSLSRVTRDPMAMDAGAFDVRCPICDAVARYQPTSEEADMAPTSVYGLTKVQQEQLARQVATIHGLPITILRLFNVFGPGQSLRNPYVGVLGTFFRRLRAGDAVELYEDGQMLRDFVSVDDVVNVFVRCTGDEACFGRTWNVGSGHGVTVQELARTLAEMVGATLRSDTTGRYRLGDVRHAVADVSRIHRDIGYAPAVPMLAGLKAFAQWALDNEENAEDDLAEDELRSRNFLRVAKT